MNTLYRCLDKLVVHKEAFFSFLHERWTRLFDARFDVLLYDLTSTYFESDPPFEDKRQFGYSRDKRSDCVQVVIALIVTPDGFPLAYEVMPGNTSDNTTLAGFLEKIENQYGRSVGCGSWTCGIPTEATLATMRAHSGEVDHRFRCKADHRFRSNWPPVGAKRRGVGIMSCGDRFGSRFGVFFAWTLL